MATYAAVQGVMAAIQDMLKERLPAELKANPHNADVVLVGSRDLKDKLPTSALALYLYRIGVDPAVSGGYVRALPGGAQGRVPQVPLMLHFLMIAFAGSAATENSLIGWGFQQLAITPILGADRMAAQALALPGQKLDWDDGDDVQIATEELTREELMRIWDTLPVKYCLTVPYVVRGVRIGLQADNRQYAPVQDRTLGFGETR